MVRFPPEPLRRTERPKRVVPELGKKRSGPRSEAPFARSMPVGKKTDDSEALVRDCRHRQQIARALHAPTVAAVLTGARPISGGRASGLLPRSVLPTRPANGCWPTSQTICVAMQTKHEKE